MTREEAFKEINDTQEFYINELIDTILNSKNNCLKTINFTSPTGTGKTNMMSLLCNKMSEYYFIITTLSKGQLNKQIQDNMGKLVKQDNFIVYGLCDYTSNTKRTAYDILSLLPIDKKIIWLRDEGHINTNKWQEILNEKCFKVINFSATNKGDCGIKCNFTNTMMLRTVNQTVGTPEGALDKLLEIKQQHKNVPNYNPCAIMRCLDAAIEERIIKACNERKLKYINISDQNFDMAELCADDNEYDVILNKFKIVEGIDLRRAHVLYMTNEPSNMATTIQVIGRCRRNALLYRNDIDIFDEKNKKLLENTRECFVFYNIESMSIDKDENGELCQAFCNYVSCQELKPNSVIYVENGKMTNGLNIIELAGETGTYKVEVEPKTGFNIIKPEGKFYRIKKCSTNSDNSIKFTFKHSTKSTKKFEEKINEVEEIILPKDFIRSHFSCEPRKTFNYSTGEEIIEGLDYVPFRTDRLSLDLTEKDLEKLYGLVKEKIEHFKAKFNINKLLESVNIDRYITKTPKGYKVESIPKLIYSNLSLVFNCHRVFKYKESKDLSVFIKDKPSLGIGTEHLEETNFYPDRIKARKYIVKVLNKIRFSIKVEKALNDISLNTLVLISTKANKTWIGIPDLFPDLFPGYSFPGDTYIISIDSILSDLYRMINIEYTIHVDVFNSEVMRDEKYNKKHCRRLSSNTLKNIKIHDYDLTSKYYSYEKTVNDKESAIIGVDLMKQVTLDNGKRVWSENKAVTSKVTKYSKVNTFIMNNYAKELAYAKNLTFTGKNNFNFDSKCNSCLGYCVEYYSKYLVYGELYLKEFLEKALEESKCDKLNEALVVRACMLKYKDNMMKAYGAGVSKIIKTISTEQLIKQSYKEFVSTVIKLATKTSAFVKQKLNINSHLAVGDKLYDPNLSIEHIAGLADYIDKNTIIDIKTTNNISINHIKQVLAYHYLSTKRTDLLINRVIVYDSVSDRSIEINLDDFNSLTDKED